MAVADEMATILHLSRIIGEDAAYEIADTLGIASYDMRWVTPTGIDVTVLCEQSNTGGFGSVRWTLRGWVLDQQSLIALMAEYPGVILD